MTPTLFMVGREVAFAVPGTPIAQGSKVGRIVGRGVALVEKANMATKHLPARRLTRWRARVAAVARQTMTRGDASVFTGPLELSAEFAFVRPPSHYTRTGALRKGAPDFPTRPDLSKLIRAVEDALSGVVYRDDAQVMEYGTVLKRYAAPGRSDGVHVKVRQL